MSNHLITPGQAIDQFIAGLDYFTQFYNMGDGYRDKITDAFTDLVSTFGSSPEDFFPIIATGAFKECYSLDTLIIKFTSKYNPTERELNLLNAARAYGVEGCFIPSFYIELPPNTIKLEHLDGDSSDYMTWDSNFDARRPNDGTLYATYAIIQPRLLSTVEAIIIKNGRGFERYNKYCDSFMTSDGFTADIDYYFNYLFASKSHFWVRDFCARLTTKQVEKFRDLAKDYCISDLHSGNIGYLKDPSGNVSAYIVDWLSN